MEILFTIAAVVLAVFFAYMCLYLIRRIRVSADINDPVLNERYESAMKELNLDPVSCDFYSTNRVESFDEDDAFLDDDDVVGEALIDWDEVEVVSPAATDAVGPTTDSE